ncbi:molecular chaperone DnaK [Methyloceanibacter methanicus]|uniref:Molecular chaperone DnaK n=1 Tax=Methyloceanibacter methanicus TaxID=1774968 RepID=A0A1E3W2W5_9HYPH|nr:TraR/DksA family transcriptional regulator [Methyloceanibacter methanicus]ODR99476.1 molecular chaperone DnaK [Methyloceanibacter methanicus]
MSKTEADLRALRAELVERLQSLRDASEMTADNRRPVELDQTSVGRVSRMDAMQVQAMAVASERRRHDEARRVEAAIKRIDEGEYGYCIVCGEEIAEKRLAVDPTVATCITCAT